MAEPRKVLLITEGKGDKKFVNSLLNSFSVKDCQVTSFKANVYQLYDIMSSDDANFEDLDVQGVLLENVKSLTNRERDLLCEHYSDIYLIFDFDPQDSAYDCDKREFLADWYSQRAKRG